jgi:hypothetical protein
MTELKLLRIEEGDSQKTLTDKINSNFSNLIIFDGGPYGRIGEKGPEGSKGLTGPIGSYGDLGIRGSVWAVGPCQPSPETSIVGDFWLNTDNSNYVYQFRSDGIWDQYGFNLKSEDLFRVYGPLFNSVGTGNKYGYFLSSNTPINYTVVITDNQAMISGTEFSPNPIFNPQYSKFVISVDGTNSNKNILEFTKSNYNDVSFTEGTPRFYWNPGPTSERGNYGLVFKNYDETNFSLPSSTLNLKSTASSISFNSTGFNLNMDSQRFFSVTSSGEIYFDFNNGTSLFSTRNIAYNSGEFNLTTSLNIYAEPSDQSPPLHLISASSGTGNLRYLYNSTPNNSAFLFRIVQGTGILFSVFGAGYVFMNKKVNSIQAPQTLTQTVSENYGSESVNWTTIIPSVSVNSSSGDYFYSNNGSDFVIERSPSASPGDRGICIWTPATGGPVGFNGGWLNLVEDREAIIFRVHSTNPGSTADCFRCIGLNTSQSPNIAPSTFNSGVNESIAFLPVGEYASSVEFTVVNIRGATGGIGGTGGTRRWYKVYYSAWGGNLSDNYCGVLTTSNSTA